MGNHANSEHELVILKGRDVMLFEMCHVPFCWSSSNNLPEGDEYVTIVFRLIMSSKRIEVKNEGDVMELIRKQMYITSAQNRAIKRLAQQQGITEAEVLRQALELFLTREGIRENEDAFADLIGLFSGTSEVDHDNIYSRYKA